MKYDLVAVFPAFNEGKNLERLLKAAVAAALAHGYSAQTVRFVVVDNGSTDNTADKLRALATQDVGAWLHVVTVRPNRGYGDGLIQGLRCLPARWLAYTHADMQCDPADIFRGLDLAKKSDEKVLAKGIRQGRDRGAKVVTWGFEAWAKIRLNLRVGEINAQPKVFPAELLTHLLDPPDSYGFDLYLLSRALRQGYKLLSFEVLLAPRDHGASSWSSSIRGRLRTMWRMGVYVDQLARKEGRVVYQPVRQPFA